MVSSLSFFFFLAWSQSLQIGCLPYFHTWCGLSTNLGCRSETCCTQIAGNTGHKKSPSGHHRTTLWAISLQLRHILTIKKNFSNSNIYHMSDYGPLTAEVGLPVWGTLANFNRFCILAALLHGTLVVGISQTLRHWTEGATYIWQGVGHWPTFLVDLFIYFVYLFIWCCCCLESWYGLQWCFNNRKLCRRWSRTAIIVLFCEPKQFIVYKVPVNVWNWTEWKQHWVPFLH